MTPVLNTHRTWPRRLLDAVTDALFAAPRHAPLHTLDPRTLADIGIHPSEIASIEAEARGRAAVTRRCIAPVAVRHA
jgi:uncharacterized protein YjiS (DUF1127 family)